jgi:uncharacterized protein with GYD domain
MSTPFLFASSLRASSVDGRRDPAEFDPGAEYRGSIRRSRDGLEEGLQMGKYLFHGSYSTEGLRGIIKEGGSARTMVVETLAKSVGGSLESFHFAFGDDSYYIICDLPNDEAAAAVSLTVTASGAVSNTTEKLLTPAQVDAAVKLSPKYRAPGK